MGSPVSLRIFSEREAEVFCVFERDSLDFFGLRVCKGRNHNTFRLYKRWNCGSPGKARNPLSQRGKGYPPIFTTYPGELFWNSWERGWVSQELHRKEPRSQRG